VTRTVHFGTFEEKKLALTKTERKIEKLLAKIAIIEAPIAAITAEGAEDHEEFLEGVVSIKEVFFNCHSLFIVLSLTIH
jgi:hypothetical protein